MISIFTVLTMALIMMMLTAIILVWFTILFSYLVAKDTEEVLYEKDSKY